MENATGLLATQTLPEGEVTSFNAAALIQSTDEVMCRYRKDRSISLWSTCTALRRITESISELSPENRSVVWRALWRHIKAKPTWEVYPIIACGFAREMESQAVRTGSQKAYLLAMRFYSTAASFEAPREEVASATRDFVDFGRQKTEKFLHWAEQDGVRRRDFVRAIVEGAEGRGDLYRDALKRLFKINMASRHFDQAVSNLVEFGQPDASAVIATRPKKTALSKELGVSIWAVRLSGLGRLGRIGAQQILRYGVASIAPVDSLTALP
jgi:hypothetical protein